VNIKIKEVKTKSELDQVFAIRREVFVEEQNVSEEIEMDEYDVSSQHVLATIDGKPVGTARWRKTNEGIKLERFAVLKLYRGKNIGAELVYVFLRKHSPERYIYLNAQEKVISFYEKFGFVAEGDCFYEAGIPHKKMVLKNR